MAAQFQFSSVSFGVRGVDVRSADGLRRAVEAVAASPGGWESGLGVVVARAVVERVGRLVGSRRLGWAAARLGMDEARATVVAAVLDSLMLRSGEVVSLGGDEVWRWLVRRCVWELSRAVADAELRGLGGDSSALRLRDRLAAEGVSVVSVEDVQEGQVRPVCTVSVGRERRFCERQDLGPVLGGVVTVLGLAGVDGRTAAEGTARVTELAASWRASQRHTQARRDAREGVLAGLGVGEAAASAWMSLVAGSKKLGDESSLVLALRRREVDADGGWLVDEALGGRWSARHRVWVFRVAAGVGVPRTAGDGGVQLTLFGGEGCQRAA